MVSAEMARAIWKFDVPVNDTTMVDMPDGAVILTHVTALSHAMLQVWAIVNPDAEKVTRVLKVVGTGNPMPAVGEYIGTVETGMFVWHLFDDCA